MIELLIVFALGWWLGGLVNTALQRMAFLKILADLGVSREQLERVKSQNLAAIEEDLDPPEKTLEIKLEQHQGVIYAFRKDNDHFLGQGSDREQLIDRLRQQFSGIDGQIKLIIREEDGANLIKNG